MTAIGALVDLLRDRQDASEIRRIATRLVGLFALAQRGEATPWRDLIAGGAEAIETERRRLEAQTPGLWPTPLPALPPDRMAALLRAVSTLKSDGDDSLGEVFSGLIGQLARSEGKRGGQYFTPPSIRALLLALVPTAGRTVYDPCCGSGGLLVAAGSRAARLVGQELNPETWRLARWNARIHGLSLDVGPRPADTLRTPLHRATPFDAILANPPFNLAHWGDDALLQDPRFRLGPPLKNANFAWLLHILSALAPGGRAAVILPNGSLYGKSARERAIRASLLAEGRVEAILALPDQLFHNTVIGACVWVLGEAHPHVHLFDLRRHGERLSRSRQALPESIIARVEDSLRRARAGERLDVVGWARSLPASELEADLRPGHRIPGEVGEARPSREARDGAIAEVERLTREAQAADRRLLAAMARLRGEPEA